jgi:hypothetical protein
MLVGIAWLVYKIWTRQDKSVQEVPPDLRDSGPTERAVYGGLRVPEAHSTGPGEYHTPAPTATAVEPAPEPADHVVKKARQLGVDESEGAETPVAEGQDLPTDTSTGVAEDAPDATAPVKGPNE